jgi:TM2 domain-containing membrane protein YozV
LPLSLHNFYLGYYGRGAAAIALLLAGLYLVLLGFFGGLYSGAGLTFLVAIGTAMLGGWFIWQITDLVRIVINKLKPKNGEYNAHLFQLKPDANSTTPPRTD